MLIDVNEPKNEHYILILKITWHRIATEFVPLVDAIRCYLTHQITSHGVSQILTGDERALANAMKADWGALWEGWDEVEAGVEVENDGEAIWHINLSFTKHLASIWPRQEQKLHFKWFWGLLDTSWVEFDENENELGFCEPLCEADCAENAVEVPDRLERIWSMLQRDWTTDCLSNLSRTEMVLTTSSNEWGSTLMMVMTASSS